MGKYGWGDLVASDRANKTCMIYWLYIPIVIWLTHGESI